MPLEVGVALWSMQSTAAAPSSWPLLYADLQHDARHAESLGFDSLWVAEHRFWYDGWCPQPLVAAAAALGATTRLAVGTAMHLLPQHSAERSAIAADALHRLSGRRFHLGVGLGYRDEEYDGLGLARRERGKRMDAALDLLAARFDPADHAPVWVGGMAEPAIRRAARRGLSLLLPPTLHPGEVRAVVGMARREAAAAGALPGRVGMVKDTWLGDPEQCRRWRASITGHYREYAGAWWMLRGQPGFSMPGLLDRQMRRTADTTVSGDAASVTDQLAALAAAGVDMLALHVSGDVTRHEYHDVMERLARDVIPRLKEAR